MSENSTEDVELEQAESRSEDERVESWRFEILARAGFPPRLAYSIARARETDVRLAERLLLAGCAPELAASIVL